MSDQKEYPKSSTQLDAYRDLSEKQGKRKAEDEVMSTHRALMGERAKARDAQENAHDKQREEKKK